MSDPQEKESIEQKHVRNPGEEERHAATAGEDSVEPNDMGSAKKTTPYAGRASHSPFATRAVEGQRSSVRDLAGGC